jgi:hypothetical protein
MSMRSGHLCIATLFALSGCAGSGPPREATASAESALLLEASDSRIAVVLDGVIARNGPGSWINGADWDEYRMGVRAVSPGAVQVTGIAIIDAFGTRFDASADRSALAEKSRETERRYDSLGKRIFSRPPPLESQVAPVLGPIMSVASMVPTYGLAVVGVVAAGAGALKLGNAIAGNSEIGVRSTSLPIAVTDSQPIRIAAFFPVTPAPARLEVAYSDAEGRHVLAIDTRQALANLYPLLPY